MVLIYLKVRYVLARQARLVCCIFQMEDVVIVVVYHIVVAVAIYYYASYFSHLVTLWSLVVNASLSLFKIFTGTAIIACKWIIMRICNAIPLTVPLAI